MESLKELINVCSELLAAENLTIAFAESATAGKLAFEFSQTGHSGEVLRGALVCYDAHIKENVLGIPRGLVEEFSAESAEVTRDMAIRLKKMMQADVVVSVTGLTTPGGSERPNKPVGTMFYCVIMKGQIIERKKVFSGGPEAVVDLTIEQIGKTIIQTLKNQQ